MKVKDLIEILGNYNPEDMVVVSGYEKGFTENFNVYETELYLNAHTEWYYGEHDDRSFILDEDASFERADAVVISR